MSCLQGPTVVPPTLPAPLSIATPPLPLPPFDVALCCKTPPFPTIPSIPSIGVTLLPGSAVAPINAFIQQVVGYINGLAVPCPFE